MKFLLQISAELENVCSLRPDGNGGVNSVTMPYFFHLNCEKCGEITDEQCTYLNQRVNHKGKTYNHVLKCKGCDRVGTVKLISGSGKEYTAADSGAYVPLMVFDVEGLLMHRSLATVSRSILLEAVLWEMVLLHLL
ncbi:uncharacterized protein LOC107811688 isoform X2 [Nicotiana tabacum]|uniref:Uncharacterized protein LOC107811688 isoform X2 n=1 Tax=Nicotiana tabacum TaxID=4097 RepID=A0AC58UCL7_TOBAC